ncbi:Ubiquitin-like domain-containing CTD phosphatase 1 [Sparganum proliferum]
MAMESGLKISVKFNGKVFVVSDLQSESTVLDLKKKLYELTMVPPRNQKLLGLAAVLGSTEEAINTVKAANSVVSESIDDFDFNEGDLEAFQRSGKRLLVLDIDYTIFDHLTPVESAKQLMRPYLYELLTRAYVNYDIAIWSATSMTWILAKIGQMNLIPKSTTDAVRQQQVESRSPAQRPDHASNIPQYETDLPFKICLLVDSGAMISVYLEEHGVKEVKPLAVIWNRFPCYGPQNTIMFDDVRRNFAMNPQSGLRIHSYRDAHVNYATDKELLYLADYLDLIALLEPDFTKLNHHKWSAYVERNRRHLCQKKGLPASASVTVPIRAGEFDDQDDNGATDSSERAEARPLPEP